MTACSDVQNMNVLGMVERGRGSHISFLDGVCLHKRLHAHTSSIPVVLSHSFMCVPSVTQCAYILNVHGADSVAWGLLRHPEPDTLLTCTHTHTVMHTLPLFLLQMGRWAALSASSAGR